MEILHVGLVAIGGVGSLAALYASYRLLKFKDEFKTEITNTITETCVSKESFVAHEKNDGRRFESFESISEQRHKEVREDVRAVGVRVDALLIKVGGGSN